MQEGTRHGIELYYINPSMFTDSVPVLLAITNEKDTMMCLSMHHPNV